VNAIKSFLDTGRLMDSKLNALTRYNGNYQNENLQYKCKSLATIYNFFTIKNNCIEISHIDEIYKFLTDTTEYSIEHFIVSKSQKVTYNNKEYQLPESSRKYSTYIFNFIFIPQSINDSLKNYHIKHKLDLLEQTQYASQIKCKYSKMIINLAKESFLDEVQVTNLNDKEFSELEKYWLITFRNEFKNFTIKVIEKLIEHFKNQ